MVTQILFFKRTSKLISMVATLSKAISYAMLQSLNISLETKRFTSVFSINKGHKLH